MRNHARIALSVAGAAVLAVSLLTGALASAPPIFHSHAKSPAKKYSVSGNLTVHGTVRADNNLSSYGKLYAHGGEQIWKGLIVRTGGVATDSLVATGDIKGQSGTFGGNLTVGGNLQGGSLAVTGGANITGSLTTGALTAGSISTNGSVTAGSLTVSNVTASGTVDFTNATVKGLNTSVTGAQLNGATIPSLNIGTLFLGNASSGNYPLSLSQNNKTATLGVNSNGGIQVQDFSASGNAGVGGGLSVTGGTTVGGALTLTGTSGIIAPSLAAPNPSGSSSPGALTLQGSTITHTGATVLNGTTTIATGNDLVLSTVGTPASASHILSSGDRDVAGTVAISGIPSGGAVSGTEYTGSYTFTKAYANAPIVTVTAVSDPGLGTSSAPRVWVTTTTSGFTIHFVPTMTGAAGQTISYNYHVIGS